MHVSVINIILSFAGALVFHEIGHFLAARICQIGVSQAGLGWGPKLYGVRVRGVDYHLRLLPLGAYVRMDMAGFRRRPLIQQLFVLFAGIAVNLTLATIAWGTFFGTFNLALAIGNLLPLYQQDGWKSGMVICRWVFGRTMPLVEWSFTISGGLMSLVLLAYALFTF
jgi:membrane-associated protease RseP (regulator of RpoE activity)